MWRIFVCILLACFYVSALEEIFGKQQFIQSLSQS